MKKNLLLSLGASIAIAAPLTAVISCGSDDVYSIKTASYPDSLKKLAGGDITLAGAWGDAKVTVDKDTKDLIEVVGVVKRRVANDGIQVRGNMSGADQFAVQSLFKDLITIANNQKAEYTKELKKMQATNKNAKLSLADYINKKNKPETGLLIEMNGKVKSVFEIYSHADYKKIGNSDKISAYIKGEWKSNIDMLPGAIKPSSQFNANSGTIFKTANNSLSAGSKTLTGYGYDSGKNLKIQFIPSNDPTAVNEATDKLKQFMIKAGLTGTEITVSQNYEAAAKLLKDRTIDIAFLPVDAWYQQTGTADSAGPANFILQAARPIQIATLGLDKGKIEFAKDEIKDQGQAINLMNKYSQLSLKDAKEDGNDDFKNTAASDNTKIESKIKSFASGSLNPNDFLSSSYESYIYGKKGSPITKAIQEARKNQGNDWKLKWDEQKKNIKYGFTSKTSSASMVFPLQWFKNHFEGFKGF